MPPSTWDIPTFAQQQQDIEEIDSALPLLDSQRSTLQQRQSTLQDLATTGQDVSAELHDVEEELEAVDAQRRGRLMMAKECEEANRRMLEDVSVEFLTKGEREQLGGLRLKLSRILFQYGESEGSEGSV